MLLVDLNKVMKRAVIFMVGLASCLNTMQAQNPIVPPGMYIADPEAHVWNDGKIYIYGSRDESDDYWCSYTHHVLSSEDLISWNIVENAFASKGTNDQVADHDKLLFAPDCGYKEGTYYLYYCSPGKPKTGGVATSTSPVGPFINGQPIKGVYGIDPAVFIDDDGQGYYFWGQVKPKLAKLKSNMTEIDESTIVEPLDQSQGQVFHEGSSIRKIGGLYYLVFADESRDHRPTCLGYAISEDPMGPYKYKGIIIDNMGSDPQVWNNHGSIEKFNEQWYVFYHRPTNNSRKFRKACVEPITINPDGTIDEVEMTTQGALGRAIVARGVMQAERACFLSGSVYISSLETTDVTNEGLVNISNGDYVAYKYLDFEKRIGTFKIKTSESKGGQVELRIDDPKGKVIGNCEIAPSVDNNPYNITSCPVNEVKGEHALYLIFKGEEKTLFNIDWFEFN